MQAAAVSAQLYVQCCGQEVNLCSLWFLHYGNYSGKAGGVMWLFVLSFVLWLTSDGRRPSMVDMDNGDPVEVVKSWCWSRAGCGFTITFPLPLTQRIDPAFYDVFWLDRGRHRVSLQLCYRDLRNNAGISTDFELSDHILFTFFLCIHCWHFVVW